MESSTESLDCPVCPRRDLPADATACPNCGVELTLLRRIRSLGEGLSAPRAPERTQWLAGALGAFLLLSWIAGALYLSRLQAEFDSLRGEIAVPREQKDEPAGTTVSDAGGPTPEMERWREQFAKTGALIVQQSPGELAVAFRGPVFAGGSDELLPHARRLLSEIATALRSEGKPVSVSLKGYTDEFAVTPGGRWPDNWSLGLARAGATAQQLRREAGDALAWIRVESGAGTLPPGVDSLADAASRSVVLTLCVSCEPTAR